MTTSLTPAELSSLRTSHPHVSKFYMSIYKPSLVYSGTVGGTPAFGAQYITVVDVSGDITDIKEGYTVKVKDSNGLLVSKRRYKSRSGQVLKLDENTVYWVVGYTIEVYDSRELWTVYPYIDSSSNYTFYKDYDVAYSDQNINIPPVAIAGPTRVGFLDDTSVSFDLDGSGSYVMSSTASSIYSYLWSCDTGTIAAPTSAITTITFTVAGQHVVKLTVTDDMNVSQSTYRIFFVHTRTGSDAPYTSFQLDSLAHSWSSGGSNARVVLRGASNIDDIEDGAFVVIWSEVWYNGTEEYIGESGNIRFAGYILSETIKRSVSDNEVSFEIGTIDSVMKTMRMFSISLEAVPSGNYALAWYQFPYNTLTVARAVHHLYKWHSTLLNITDVFLPVEDTTVMTACDDMTDGNLFTLADWTYENGIFAKLYCDKMGRVHLSKDAFILDKTSRDALPTYMEIISQDWRGGEGLQVYRKTDSQTALIIASGVANIAGTFTPLMSQAPGTVPNNFGDEITNIERLVLSSQASLNTIAGRLYAIANGEISEIVLEFSGDYPITLATDCWYTLTIPASYTNRGIDIDIRMQCKDITESIDVSAGTIFPSCTFEVDYESVDGVTVIYPEDPEQPYSPIPPYVPYIPYIPNIPVIYPPVPTPPGPNYPDPGDTPEEPEEPEIPPIPALCRDTLDYESNGPFYVYSGEVVDRIVIPKKFHLRSPSATYKSSYTLNAKFYTVDPTNGNYIESTSDDFYEIYALDCTGTRVATGIHDPVTGSGHQRTGVFNQAADVDICSIEIVVSTAVTFESAGSSVMDFSGFQPPSYTTPVGSPVFSHNGVVGSGDPVLTQYAGLCTDVSNPPWVWDVVGHIRTWTTWHMPTYPLWFRVQANIYALPMGSPSWAIKTPFSTLYAEDAYGIDVNVKYPGHGSVDDTIICEAWNTATNIKDMCMTTQVTTEPIKPKVQIDSFLLWNICGHSDLDPT